MSALEKLETFSRELDDYKYYRLLEANKEATRKQVSDSEVLRNKLLRDAGRFRGLIKELTDKEKITVTTKDGRESAYDMWFKGLEQRFGLLTVEALSRCIDVTNAAIGKLEDDIKNGIRDKETGLLVAPQTKMTTEAPKAFIAHEGMTRALQKVKDFLDALGVKYLIAEIEPSDGRVVEGQVQWTQEKADFAIILATKGKIINKETGKPQMGLNVADELGRAREVFKNRIILLLQKGVEPHTNISGIAYEPFTPQNMGKAFIKIIKELRNWDFIRVEKVEE